MLSLQNLSNPLCALILNYVTLECNGENLSRLTMVGNGVGGAEGVSGDTRPRD